MIYILTLTLLLVIAIMFSLLGTKSRITSPLPLHFLPWLLTLIVGISNYDQFYEFNERSFYSLLIWFTVIFIFYFIGELVNYKRENINVYYGLSHIKYECKKYWIIVIPISLYTIFFHYIPFSKYIWLVWGEQMDSFSIYVLQIHWRAIRVKNLS